MGAPPTRRPLVHMNLAMFADGRVAAASGRATSISCPADWRRVHTLRETYAAVAVGAYTWQRDRPRLNARAEHLGRAPRRQPDRVVFAGSQTCHVRPDGRRTFVIGCAARAHEPEAVAIECREHDLGAPLHMLRDRFHITSLLVEGGPTLLGSFISQGCVDRITIYVRTADPAEAARSVRTLFTGLPDDMHAQSYGDGVLVSSIPPERQAPQVPQAPAASQ